MNSQAPFEPTPLGSPHSALHPSVAAVIACDFFGFPTFSFCLVILLFIRAVSKTVSLGEKGLGDSQPPLGNLDSELPGGLDHL